MEHGIVDSTGIVELVEFLEHECNIAVANEYITEENLGTIGAIALYVFTRQADTGVTSRAS